MAINNTIDNLSREGEPQNMFINDPKGELFAGFHKLLENRGYEVVVLNLLNYNMTHQFNVLGPVLQMLVLVIWIRWMEQLNTVINTFFPIEVMIHSGVRLNKHWFVRIVFAMIDFTSKKKRIYSTCS